jgi:hypothetical protein
MDILYTDACILGNVYMARSGDRSRENVKKFTVKSIDQIQRPHVSGSVWLSS